MCWRQQVRSQASSVHVGTDIKYFYGSLGTGTVFHLVGANFARRMELKIIHVAYKGGVAAVQDVVGNQIDMIFLLLTPSYIQMAEVGRLKVLGMLSPERNPAMPQVPAVDEIPQLRGFQYSMWAGLFVPARLPLEKAAAIGKATHEIVSAPNFRACVEERGTTAGTTKNLDEAAAYFERESQRFEKIAADVKIEREQPERRERVGPCPGADGSALSCRRRTRPR